MKKPRQFRIDEELLARFDRVNDNLAVNGSEVVRRLIEEYTKEKEKELNVMAKVVEYIEERTDFPAVDEAYTVGKVDAGRYFFAWGPDFPKNDEVPAYEIEDGESGISYHDTADEALKEMQAAVDAVEDTRHFNKKQEELK